MIINTSRSVNGSVLVVSWQPVSLEDAGGFYRNSIILSTNETNNQVVIFSKYIPYSESSTVFVGLESFTTYTLTVSIVVIDTAEGVELVGPNSEPIRVTGLLMNG